MGIEAYGLPKKKTKKKSSAKKIVKKKPTKVKKKIKKKEAGFPRGQNPSFLANIAKPGEVKNPKGRPAGQLGLMERMNRYLKRPANCSSEYIKELAKDLGIDPKTANVAEVVMANFIHQSMVNKAPGFMQQFMDRQLGRVQEKPEIPEEELVVRVQEVIEKMQQMGGPAPPPETKK